MTRYTIVFPGNGQPSYIKGSKDDPHAQVPNPAFKGVAIMPDLPDFVSSVDGKTYSGRSGMREHNKLHNVVPLADVAGLPTMQMNSDFRSESQKRGDAENRKRHIINGVNRHYR